LEEVTHNFGRASALPGEIKIQPVIWQNKTSDKIHTVNTKELMRRK
jgi:hypothetical protein